ncbi:MAG: S-layer homology domain-containing protein [Chloroflexia bacterium]
MQSDAMQSASRQLWLRCAALAVGIGLCLNLILAEPSQGGAAPAGPAGTQPAPPMLSAQIGAMPVGRAANVPTNVLYDQYDHPTQIGISSQQFEPAYSTYNDRAADDFAVPSGQTWTVTGVDVSGSYYNGPGPADSVNVSFYNNGRTVPGTPVFTQTNIVYSPGPNPGDFVITLSPPAVLRLGTYWVSVQANQQFNPNGQWYWRDRYTLSQSAAAWSNPDAGFRHGCSNWGPRSVCNISGMAPDQVFRLNGLINATPSPTATGTPPTATATRTPVTPTATFTGTQTLPCPVLTQPPALPSPTVVPACGLIWRGAPSVNATSGDNGLNKIVAVSPNDLWAVGSFNDHNTPDQTLTEHWTGAAWNVVPSPNVGSNGNALFGATVVSPNDIWAVGETTANSYFEQTLIEHWDGTTWSVVPGADAGGYSNVLYSVSATGPSDVWAVGLKSDQGGLGHQLTLIEHWNGSAWHILLSPSPSNLYDYLTGVKAFAPDNAWAVGYSAGDSGQALILHWDGTDWRRVPTPKPATIGNGLRAIGGLSPNDIWAVGSSHTSNNYVERTLAEHWDGSSWSLVPSPNVGNDNSVLDGVAVVSPQDVWAVGTHLDSADTEHTLAEHWNGSTWTVVTSPDQINDDTYLRDAVAVSSSDIWAVGSYFHGCYRVVVERYNDPCVVPSPTPSATNTPYSTPAPTSTATATRTPCMVGLSDVHPSDYFYAPVEYLACHGIISGYSNGTYRPYNNTTRSQMVKIVVIGFGMEVATPTPPAYSFTDVTPSNPFFAVIETAAAADIVNGYACGAAPAGPCDSLHRPYFLPYAAVTRGQLSKIVVITAQWRLINSPEATFEDVAPGSTFYTVVETAYCHGIISGYQCGTTPLEPCDPQGRPYFRPNNDAIRGQIAKIVYGAITGASCGTAHAP